MKRSVEQLLQGFAPVDAAETEHARRMVALLEAPAPFSRATFRPGHFTASAFVLSPDQRDLLLILHAKLGRWLQPGGHIDPGDPDPLAAARREVAEETGLHELQLGAPGLFDVDVHAIPPRRSEPGHEHFDLRFLFVAPTRAVQAASDARAARWVPLHAVETIESDASVMRAVRRLLARRHA